MTVEILGVIVAFGLVIGYMIFQVGEILQSHGVHRSRPIHPIHPIPPANRVSAGQPSCESSEVVTHQDAVRAVPAGVRGDFINLCRGARPHTMVRGRERYAGFNDAIRLVRNEWCTECGQSRVVPLDKDPRYV